MFKTIPVLLSMFIVPAFAGWEISRGSEKRTVETILEVRHATDSIHILCVGSNGEKEWFKGAFRLVSDSQPESVKQTLDKKDAELKRAKSEIAKLRAELDTLKKGDGINANTGSPPSPLEKANSAVPIPTFELLDRKIDDTPIKTQVALHGMVSGTITELGLKQLLQKLYDESIETREFKHHGGSPTHVFIWLYPSKDHFKSGMGQWIAMLSRVGEGSNIETNVKTELIDQLDEKPEVKDGLEESTRKEVFREIVTAEDRAMAQAQRLFPLPVAGNPGYSQEKGLEQLMKQGKTYNTLSENFKSELAKRYGITSEQLGKISVEGVTKNWPMP